MHAGKVAAYWYATAIVLVMSAILRLVSRPMVAPVWLPAAEIAAGVGIGALAWWVGRGAKPARLTALVAGTVVVAGAAALYLMHIGYEFAAFPAAVGTVVAASSAAAFVRTREPAAAAAPGWPGGYGGGYPPQHPPAPASGPSGYPPQYAPQYRPHHAPTDAGPTSPPVEQRPGPSAPPDPAPTTPTTQPPPFPRTPYPTSREGAEEHSLQARVRRRPRHAAPQEPQEPQEPAEAAPQEPVPSAQAGEGGGFTPDEHPDVELAPRRRRHAKPEAEDPGPAGGPSATP